MLNEVGEALGFGSGPFRAAVAEEERPEADRSLTYAGAPPYRVLSADPQAGASSEAPPRPHISPISPLYLPYISPISPQASSEAPPVGGAQATHGAAIDAVLGTEKG